VQNAVYTLAQAQYRLVRLDVNIGTADLYGVLEQRMQQLHYRRVDRVLLLNQALQVYVAVAQFLTEFLGQVADLFGAPVDQVERTHQFRFAHHGEANRLSELLGYFVVGEYVGRIRHAHQQAPVALTKHDGAKTPRQRLRQFAYRVRIEAVVRQVDQFYIELARQQAQHLIFRYVTQVNQRVAQLAAGFFLLPERDLELFVGDDVVLNQQIADAHFFT
jgi:hypothetical protein